MTKKLALILLAAFTSAAAFAASAPHTRRTPVTKPSRQLMEANVRNAVAVLKLHEGTDVRLRNGAFIPPDRAPEDAGRAVRDGLTPPRIAIDLARLMEIIHANHLTVSRMFSRPEGDLDLERRLSETRSDRELADLNLYYLLQFPENRRDGIGAILDQLNALQLVEFAMPDAGVAPPPAAVDANPPTPSFESFENYLNSTTGVNVLAVRPLAGGRGEGQTLIDVEDGWTIDHEDLNGVVFQYGENIPDYYPTFYNGQYHPTDPPWREHGTGVIGVVNAAENAYGTTGIAPSAHIGVSGLVQNDTQWNNGVRDIPDAISHAMTALSAGNVILLEAQTYYTASGTTTPLLWPPEIEAATLDIASTATAAGFVVVETAGNGSVDLDSSQWNGDPVVARMRSLDSGAIVVGAGVPSSRAAEDISNYGLRVNVQGIGEGVYTLGYGDIGDSGSDLTQFYTARFNGTSSAGPVVAGAAVVVQATQVNRGLAPLTSVAMRSLLASTGKAQGGSHHVGPLPDVRQAVDALFTGPTIQANGSAANVTVTWSVVPGASRYHVYRQDVSSGSYNEIGSYNAPATSTTDSPAAGLHRYRVRAENAIGDLSLNSNDDFAVLLSFTDYPLVARVTPVRASHLVDLRNAVNALCDFAGAAACASHPYTGAALDANAIRGQSVIAGDFGDAVSRAATLFTAIGVSTSFHVPAPGEIIHTTDVDQLRDIVR